jgi:hypothetical protein
MANEHFLSRWSRRKAQVGQAGKPSPATGAPAAGAPAAGVKPPVQLEPAAPDVAPGSQERPPHPTLDDVARLTTDSDFSPFVARGVDETVKRSALKKLFTDPHFNVMDGLDTYIDDYNTFQPIPPHVLAALNHAKALLDPLSQTEKALMQLVETPDETHDDTHDEAKPESEQESEPIPAAVRPALESAADPTVPDSGNAVADSAPTNANKADHDHSI